MTLLWKPWLVCPPGCPLSGVPGVIRAHRIHSGSERASNLSGMPPGRSAGRDFHTDLKPRCAESNQWISTAK